jgi:hypothetical protein
MMLRASKSVRECNFQEGGLPGRAHAPPGWQERDNSLFVGKQKVFEERTNAGADDCSAATPQNLIRDNAPVSHRLDTEMGFSGIEAIVPIDETEEFDQRHASAE